MKTILNKDEAFIVDRIRNGDIEFKETVDWKTFIEKYRFNENIHIINLKITQEGWREANKNNRLWIVEYRLAN